MGAAIIAALASILVAGISYASNRNLMDKQQDYNKDQLQQQNEYNTPSAQVDRLKDAGINPSTLAMNGGQTVMNQSANPLPFNPLPTDFSSIGNMMSSFSNSKLQFAQAKTEDLLREERYNQMKIQSQRYLSEIENLGVDTRGKQIANFYASALNEVSLMKSKSELGINLRQQAILNKNLQILSKQLEEVIPQEISESKSRERLNILNQEEVVAEIERIHRESNNLEKEGNLLDSKLDTEGLVQSNIVADTQESLSRSTQLDQQIQLYLDTYDDLVTEIAAKANISKKQAQWYIVQQIFGIGINSAIMVGSTAYGVKSIKGLKTPSRVGY